MSAENNLSEQDKIDVIIKNEAKKRKQREEEIKEARIKTAPDGEIPRDARARADRMRAEEKATDPEVALAQREKQRKLIEESNILPPGVPDKLGRIHRVMQTRGEWFTEERADIYTEDMAYLNAKRKEEKGEVTKSRPGWGRWGWKTRRQAGEIMRHIIDRFFSANVPIPDRYRDLVKEGLDLDLYPEAKEESV